MNTEATTRAVELHNQVQATRVKMRIEEFRLRADGFELHSNGAISHSCTYLMKLHDAAPFLAEQFIPLLEAKVAELRARAQAEMIEWAHIAAGDSRGDG